MNVIEKWTPVYLDGIKTQYIVSDSARCVNVSTNKELRPLIRQDQRRSFTLYCVGKRHTMMRSILVYMSFNPDTYDPRMDINHIDGDKTNDFLYNLEQCTRSQNMTHAYKTGLIVPRRGEKHGRAVYSDNFVHKICKLISKGYSSGKICDILGLERTAYNYSRIYHIHAGYQWKHISSMYDFPKIKKRKRKFNDEQLNQIRSLHDTGLSIKNILKELNIEYNDTNRTIVRRILENKTYKINIDDGSTTIDSDCGLYIIID